MITTDDVDAFVAEVYPVLSETGIRCEAVGDGTSLLRWPYDPVMLRPGGYISGPTQMMLADAGLWIASFTLIGLEEMAVTSHLALTFLRPAVDGDLLAATTVVSQSRRRIHGTVSLWVGDDRDRLVSHGVGSYAVPVER